MLNRKAFLKSMGISLYSIATGGIPLFLNRTAMAANQDRTPKTLVVIFQRGAMDGLMAVSPFRDKHLPKARPSLIMSAGKTRGSLINLDETFGLHPAFRSLYPLFQRGELAIVHGTGSPYSTRSHFEAQNYMESGTPGIKSTNSGWLNRATSLLDQESSPLQSVSITKSQPFSMRGQQPTLVIPDLRRFALPIGQPLIKPIYQALYAQTKFEQLREAGDKSISATKMISSIQKASYRPRKGVTYPKSKLGQNLSQIAQLIKANVGLEIAFTEVGGWDTHRRQGTTEGPFARQAKVLSDAIATLWNDLADHHQDVVIMTMTEFGRTVHENGSGGTDHGRGSCLFVLGSRVDGGKVHGSVPELSIDLLEDQRDVPVSTDFRCVFAEVARQHLSVTDNEILFPGWEGQPLPLFT